MKKRNKALLSIVCVVLLVAFSVMGTLAYLTDQDKAVNTFTVGKVHIKLDEADVDVNGDLVYVKGEDGANVLAERVDANEYHLLPGHTYTKDPMVTVLDDSEACFVRMFVVVTDYADAKLTFKDDVAADGTLLLQNFVDWNQTKWSFKEVTVDTVADTATYEFRYIGSLTNAKVEEDTPLEKLFTEFTVPGYVDNAGLARLEDAFAIKVYAQAMQADGFEGKADEAWTAAGMPSFN